MRNFRPFCLTCDSFTDVEDRGDSSHPVCATCGRRNIEMRQQRPPRKVPQPPASEVPEHAMPAAPRRRLEERDAYPVLCDLVSNWDLALERPAVARAVVYPNEVFQDPFVRAVMQLLVVNAGDWNATAKEIPADLAEANASRIAELTALAPQPPTPEVNYDTTTHRLLSHGQIPPPPSAPGKAPG